MRVAQSGTPRRTVGASPEHRHRRGPHRHEDAARPHGHRQVAACVGGVPLRDPTQVEARAGCIHISRTLTREPHRPPSFAHARQQAPRRRAQRRLHDTCRRRGRQGHTRNVRGPHRLDIPGGNERSDQWVERSPGRLRERQCVAQQPVGFFADDEAGAGLRGIGPPSGAAVTARGITDSGIEPRHLRRRPEHAPHVLVALNNAHDSVDDRHAVPTPSDDVDAGTHRGEGGAPRGRDSRIRRRLRSSLSARGDRRIGDSGATLSIDDASSHRGTGHSLVPREAGEA